MKQKNVLIVLIVVILIVFACLYAFLPFNHIEQTQRSSALVPSEPVRFLFRVRLRDGVPLIRIRLGGEKITVIFDTGSSVLNVSHISCTDCNNRDGKYTGSLSSKEQSVISYGSQTDTVIQLKDKLQLGDLPSSKSIEVPFYATISRKAGSSGDRSNLNIFGGNRSAQANDDSITSFILNDSDVLITNLSRINGYVAGVSAEHALNMRENAVVPYKQCSFVDHRDLPFYVVRVNSISLFCGNKRVYTAHKPLYMIVDTGSNMLSLPSTIHKHVAKKTTNCMHVKLTFKLESGAKLSIQRKHLYWNNGSQPMFDDEVNGITTPDVCIIGTHALSDKILHFTKNQLYFTDS